MILSKKRKALSSEVSDKGISAKEKVVQMIVYTCIRTQDRLASAMQKESEHLSATGKKLALIMFCLIGVCSSIYLITVNIFYKKNSSDLLITSIPLPKHVFENDENRNHVIISETEFKKIENFKNYMDSLSKSTSGQNIKDSILKSRPLLMDSVLQLEKLYQLQENYKK